MVSMKARLQHGIHVKHKKTFIEVVRETKSVASGLYLYFISIMAKARFELIQALRTTARKIENNSSYQWGHMGLCNCGFLAQEITSLTKDEIHRRAMLRHGDWSEQLNDYCPSSGLPMDDLIDQLVSFGFSLEELKHLERLSHPSVLDRLPVETRHLSHNVKADVIIYFNTWADLLEETLLNSISLNELHGTKVPIM